MVVKSAEELTELVNLVLLAVGSTVQNAQIVAAHLVTSNLSGVDTHGLCQLPMYLADIKAGRLFPAASSEVLRETDNSALVSGHWTFGQVAAQEAMNIAIEKADLRQMAVVSLVQSTHIGRLGHYVEMAAGQGQIALIFGGGYCHSDPRTVPYGGRERALDTNPVAMGFPGPDSKAPVMLDFATTAASGVKVANAQRRNEKVPEGWIVDRDGRPTVDPNDFDAGGGFAPFGGHKGYALMVAAELIGRGLAAADTHGEQGPDYPMFQHQGVTMILIRADLFQPRADFVACVATTAERIRSVPPAAGFDRVMAPGDPEVAARADRIKDGIPIADDVWQSVCTAIASVGVDVPR